MPEYTYECEEHSYFTVKQSMKEAKGIYPCPLCHNFSPRAFHVDLKNVPQIWNTQGAHRTDYDAKGDKLERLNRDWSKMTGEKPPPPSTKVPRNSKEKY